MPFKHYYFDKVTLYTFEHSRMRLTSSTFLFLPLSPIYAIDAGHDLRAVATHAPGTTVADRRGPTSARALAAEGSAGICLCLSVLSISMCVYVCVWDGVKVYLLHVLTYTICPYEYYTTLCCIILHYITYIFCYIIS